MVALLQTLDGSNSACSCRIRGETVDFIAGILEVISPILQARFEMIRKRAGSEFVVVISSGFVRSLSSAAMERTQATFSAAMKECPICRAGSGGVPWPRAIHPR
jgi:hypothetical protein